jgi:fructose-1,6-bisphosphatase/inositol monophosphatase family enzyme
MNTPDLDSVAQVLRDAAESEILPRFRQLAAADIREKGPGDLVTVADEAAEIAITPRLLALLPGSIVVGEEAAAADPELLRHLSGDQSVWVIDPIDGTANYASGVPVFAVMVALIRDDRTIASWIYDPISGEMAMAKAGSGVSVAGDTLPPWRSFDQLLRAPGIAPPGRGAPLHRRPAEKPALRRA